MTEEESLPVGQHLHFQHDEGAHPDFEMEWWYGHFSLVDSAGREYAAMAAYFNVGLKILAISDFGENRLHHVVSGSALHHADGYLDLHWSGRDHWVRPDPEFLFYRLESYGGDFGLDLYLGSQKPPLPGCGSGLVRWTGGDSYYYSLSRLEAEGEIEIGGRAVDVTGTGWMDHQWMQSLGRGGWNWFAIQLDGETEIAFWHILGPDESMVSGDMTIMFPDGSVRHTRDFSLERLESWPSPHSGNEYGVHWRVRERGHDLDLEIRARRREQELRLFETLPGPDFPFWEGSTKVSGRMLGRPVSGTGYTELVRLPGADE